MGQRLCHLRSECHQGMYNLSFMRDVHTTLTYVLTEYPERAGHGFHEL